MRIIPKRADYKTASRETLSQGRAFCNEKVAMALRGHEDAIRVGKFPPCIHVPARIEHGAEAGRVSRGYVFCQAIGADWGW